MNAYDDEKGFGEDEFGAAGRDWRVWPRLGEPGLEVAPPENDRPSQLALARKALEPVEAALTAAGFYAYGTFDDQQRWGIAADDEGGRIDVRVGADGFTVELWQSSPGLYADEDNPFRKRAMERLARMTIPRVAQGMLLPHQEAMWDEVDEGIAVRLRYELPFAAVGEIGAFVRGKLPELEALLTKVEEQVAS